MTKFSVSVDDYVIVFSQAEFFKHIRRGGDTNKSRLEVIKEHTKNNVALIGLGNLFTGEDIDKAFATGWVDLIGLGTAVMINPNMGTLVT